MDLNCDVGEMPASIADGTQEALMRSITSVNVACGGHAGDASTMNETIEQALRWKLAIGAHPGYPDRANFGRIALEIPVEGVEAFVCMQVNALAEIAERRGARLTHVKAHGALYNQAARDPLLAKAIARGVRRWQEPGRGKQRRGGIVLVGLAGSRMLDAFREEGFRAAAEAYADRRYEADGSLRSRKFEDALIRDPAEAARQAWRIAERGSVMASDGTEISVPAETICIHGDSPGAAAIAAAVAGMLKERGIALRALNAF